ncbi:MAG: ankyrin repeat domain-containing protein, partial [bacterium]|nr:ankyrin repeat domain-containing protein [bacterium]
KDMIWPDMIWPWIIAYDLWNFAYTYNCIADHSFYCGLALLFSCTIPAFFIKKGAWLHSGGKNGTPLTIAIEGKKTKAMKILIENGERVNTILNDGRTILHELALEGRLKDFKYIYKHGGDINSRDDNLNTPLHLTTMNGHFHIANVYSCK